MRKALKIDVEQTVMAAAVLTIVPAFMVVEWNLLTSKLLVPACAALIALGLILIRRFGRERECFAVLFPVVVVLQFALGYLLEVNYCSWDVYTLVKSAREWALGEPINTFYFSQYPGNIPPMLFLSWVFAVTQRLFGSTNLQFLIALNILCLDLAVVAVVRIVARLADMRTGCFAGLLFFLHIPFYLYIPICYTDIYCMPFLFFGVLAALALIDRLCRRERVDGKCGALILAFSALLFMGTQFKSSGVILLLAFLIVALLRLPWRRFALCAVAVLSLYAAMNKSFHVLIDRQQVVSRESVERHRFPRLHNIVMGLHGNGRYYREDVKYTQSFRSYEEKKRALCKKLFDRAYEMGCSGIVRQCFRKSVDTWGSTLAFGEIYLYEGNDKPVRENVLHKWIALKGPYHAYLSAMGGGCKLLFYFFVVSQLVVAAFRKDENQTLLLQVMAAGVVALLMIWETHPRYTIHLMPAFIAMAAIGMTRTIDWVSSPGRLDNLRGWLKFRSAMLPGARKEAGNGS